MSGTPNMPTELRAIKVVDMVGGHFNCQLYFYAKENKSVYKLKNKFTEKRLRVMGNCRDIHLDNDDLIEQGTMRQFETEHFHIYYL